MNANIKEIASSAFGLLAMTRLFPSLRGVDTKCQHRSNLKKDIVGIDIAEGRVSVVVLKTAPELTVKDCVVKKLSVPHTDEDISQTIQDIFTSKRLFKNKVWLNIDLPSPALNFARLSLPVMPRPELPSAIKWNLKDKISLDVKDAQLAYEIVGELQKEDGSKTLTIMAVLAENAVIDRFLNVFKKLNITLSGINVTPFSISNVLEEEAPVLICHMGIEYSYLCVYLKGKLDFVRQITLAKTTFLNAMTGVLVSDKGRVELVVEDAKKIIEESGIPKETDVVLGGRVSASQLIAMTRPAIERFTGEISRSIDYYQGELGGKRIEKILLTGEGSHIKGLNEFMSRGLNLNVEYLKVPEALPCVSGLGAAIGGVKNTAINLLPEKVKQEKKDEAKKTIIRVSTVAVLGILLLSFLGVSLQTSSYKRQLSLIQGQRLILKDLRDILDRISARQAVISNVRKKEIPADAVLKELSVTTPGNIAFLELWLNQKQKILKLKGKVSARPEATQGALSDFTRALEKSAFIKEANLSNVQSQTPETGGMSTFEINCSLK